MAGGDWQRDVLRELKQAEGEEREHTVSLQLSRAEAEKAWRGDEHQAPQTQQAPHAPQAPPAPQGAAPAASSSQQRPGTQMPAPQQPPAQARVPTPPAAGQPPAQQPPAHHPRDPRLPTVSPESEPTLDPRLSAAVGRPVRGDSVVERAGRSLRKLTASTAREVEEVTRLGREVQQPVTTGRVIAVTSIRGGVGKTTVSSLMARTFNHYRQDPVLALEMDAALGTLPVRLGADTVRWTVSDLAQILKPSMLLTDVTGYLVPVAEGGWLLPASQGRIGAQVDVEMYRTVTLALRRYFGVTVVDCECLPGEVARTAMATAHARVIVAPVTAEGVNGTRKVLDWLAGLPRGALATTVVALTASSPDTKLDLKTATTHLREAGVAVVPIAYDRHLGAGGVIENALLGEATRRSAARLAAEALQFAVRMP
ncbi:hypothetical protein ACFQVC_04655 [Streptomyces monticola]|uniref:MinD/ParA family protein n=1 Tax=Streptomyces monticola TaxID=2666263 RepID=A0ABW2JC18_9ACTN